MYQVETDSEDDYECLFLKPVDGYNISDRIRQANEELFASPGPESPSVVPRKVTFRKILEDFDDGGDNISIVSVESGGAPSSQEESNVKKKLKHIPETSEEEEQEKPETVTESETEEICEEINEVKLDLEDLPVSNEQTDEAIPTIESPPSLTKDPPNIKTRPKSPPLQRRQPEKVNSINLKEINSNSPYSSLDQTPLSPISSDDDLSVIVSSYIPENTQIYEEDSIKENGENKKIKVKKFSFRKKKNSNTSPTPQGQQQKQLKTQTKTNKKSKTKPSDTKTTNSETEDELKFYYKTCCEYKNSNSVNATLPKYTGYLSEYGLTKDQITKRQLSVEKQKKVILEKNLKASECEIQKMNDNERAFTRWLKNKMKFPVNKTKNMFDFNQSKNAKKVKC